MTNSSIPMERSKVSVWMQAVRAFSFTASMVPVVVGAVLAIPFDGSVRWELFPLVVICSLLYHAGTNLISDYFDYKRGVDKNYTFGSSRVLVEGLLTPRQILTAALLMFGIGTILGLVLIAYRGLPIFFLGLAGFLGGYLYTGKPIGYKYFALGDILVFTLMGPMMVIGSYYVLTGTYNSSILLVSLPVGFLVAAILHANNTRDIAHDSQARVKTLANLLGHSAAKGEYFLLIMAAYVSVLFMVLAKVLTPWSLLVFLSLPPALKNLKTMSKSQKEKPEELAMLDVQTAQLHLLFGVLLAISLAVAAFSS